MLLKLVFLTALLGLSNALPLKKMSEAEIRQLFSPSRSLTKDSRNNALEQIILDLLEDLRGVMITGSGNIPVLDPFNIDELVLDLNEIGVPGYVYISDLVATKLSTFVIDSLSVTMTSILLQRYSVVLEGHIPVLDVDAENYDLSVTVLGLNVFGNGKATIKILEPRIRAELTIRPRFSFGGIYLNLEQTRISFDLSDFEAVLTGMFDDEAASDFVSLFLKNLIPELVEFFEDDITAFLSSTVHGIATDILADLNLIDILG